MSGIDLKAKGTIFVLGLVIIIAGFSIFIHSEYMYENPNPLFYPEEVTITKESSWDGFFGWVDNMIYKDNYAFIGGGLDDVGLLVVSVPLFSIPLIVDEYYFPVGNESFATDLAVAEQDNHVYMATAGQGLNVLYFDNITETISM